MAWKRLTIDDLRLVLAESEVEKLNEYNKSEEITEMVNAQLDAVADMFRGAWLAKGYNLDVRDHFVAPEYIVPVLNYARWEIWTRFPMTEDFALTEPRKFGYETAKELLKNPYIGTSEPDYSGVTPEDPDYPKVVALSATTKEMITMPWLRMPPMPFQYGYPQAYFGKYAGCGCCK